MAKSGVGSATAGAGAGFAPRGIDTEATIACAFACARASTFAGAVTIAPQAAPADANATTTPPTAAAPLLRMRRC
jgi:hypothetical protein